MKVFSGLPLSFVLAVFLAAPAVAAPGPTLTSNLSNIRYTAVDLTPGDGNSASYQIADEKIWSASSLRIHHDWETDVYYKGKYLATGEAVANTFSYGPFAVSQLSSGTPGDVRSSITWDAATPDPEYRADMFNSYMYEAKLTLSAGSAIVLSGDLEQLFVPAGFNSTAESEFSLGMYQPGATSQDSAFIDVSHAFYSDIWGGPPDSGWTHASAFGATLTNSSATDITINVRFTLASSWAVWTPLSPVPEPTGYAMLAVGLAMLAGIASRRARRT